MKKLLLLATAIGATALVAPRAQAGISFGIQIGPDFHRPPPVYVAPPVCAPPVYVAPAPRPICPPVVVAPAPVYYAPPTPVYYAPPAPVYYAPPPVVYYGYRSHGWKHQHRHQGHYGHYYYRH